MGFNSGFKGLMDGLNSQSDMLFAVHKNINEFLIDFTSSPFSGRKRKVYNKFV